MENFTHSTHYALLGVSLSSNESEIRRAYYQKQLQFHPDKGGDEEMCKLLNQAFATLMDKKSRDQYDQDIVTDDHHPHPTATPGGDPHPNHFQHFLDDLNAKRNSDDIKKKLKNWQSEFEGLNLLDNFQGELSKSVDKLVNDAKIKGLFTTTSTTDAPRPSDQATFCDICDKQYLSQDDHFDRTILRYLHSSEEQPCPLFHYLKKSCLVHLASEEDKKIYNPDDLQKPPPADPMTLVRLRLALLQSDKWRMITKLQETVNRFLESFTSQMKSQDKNSHYIQQYLQLSLVDRATVTPSSTSNMTKIPSTYVDKAMSCKINNNDFGVIKNILKVSRHLSIHSAPEQRQVVLIQLTMELIVNAQWDIIFFLFFAVEMSFEEIAHVFRHLTISPLAGNLGEGAGTAPQLLCDAVASLLCYLNGHTSHCDQFKNDKLQQPQDKQQWRRETFNLNLNSIRVNCLQLFLNHSRPLELYDYEKTLLTHLEKLGEADIEPQLSTIVDDVITTLTLTNILIGNASNSNPTLTSTNFDPIIQRCIGDGQNPLKNFLGLLYTKANIINSRTGTGLKYNDSVENSSWRLLLDQMEGCGDLECAALCCHILMSHSSPFETANELHRLGQYHQSAQLYLQFETCDVDFFASKFTQSKSKSIAYLFAILTRIEGMSLPSRSDEQILVLTKFAQDFLSPFPLSFEGALQKILHNFPSKSTSSSMLPLHFLMLKYASSKFRLLGSLHVILAHGNFMNMDAGQNYKISGYLTSIVNSRLGPALDLAISSRDLQALGDLLVGLDERNFETLSLYFKGKQGDAMLKESDPPHQHWRKRAFEQSPSYQQRAYKTALYLVRATLKKIQKKIVESSVDLDKASRGLIGEDSLVVARFIAIFMQDVEWRHGHSTFLEQELERMKVGGGLDQLSNFPLLLQPIFPCSIQRDILQVLANHNPQFKWETHIWKSSSSLANAFAYLDYQPNTNSFLLAASYFLEALVSPLTTVGEAFSYLRAVEEMVATVNTISILGRTNLSLFMRMHNFKMSLSILIQAHTSFRRRWREEEEPSLKIQPPPNLNLVHYSQTDKTTQFTTGSTGGGGAGAGGRRVAQNIFPALSRMWLDLSLLHLTSAVDILPFLRTNLSCQLDTHVLSTFGSELTQTFLDLTLRRRQTVPPAAAATSAKVSSDWRFQAKYQYVQFEELINGRIKGDFGLCKMQTMDMILRSMNFRMESVLQNFHWPFSLRTEQGWRDVMEQGRLNFPGEKLTFSRIDGYDVDHMTGEIKLLLTQDNDNPHFTMADIDEIFRLGIVAAAFTLEDPASVSFAYHPFQEARFMPRRLKGSRYLATLTECDILLKELTTGTEINALPPFLGRPTREGMISKLPLSLQKIVMPIHERDTLKETVKLDVCAHRFWIEMIDIHVHFEDDPGNPTIAQFRVSSPRVEIRKHLLERNSVGELRDAKEDSSEDSSEAEFAREFSQNYDELATHFPQLARLKELQKINTICAQLRGSLEHLETLLSGPDLSQRARECVTDVLTQAEQGTAMISSLENFATFQAKVLADNTHLTVLPQSANDQIWTLLHEREANSLPNFASQVRLACHVTQVNSAQFQQTLRNWLYSRTAGNYEALFNVCFNGALAHQRAEVERRILNVKKWRVTSRPEDDLKGFERSDDCTWTPAAFFCREEIISEECKRRLQIYGGVSMTASTRAGNPSAGGGGRGGGGGMSGGGGGGGMAGGGDGNEGGGRGRRGLRPGKIWQYEKLTGAMEPGMIYGEAQTTGTAKKTNFRHAAQAAQFAEELAAKGHSVFLDTAFRTVTGRKSDSLRRPDLLWFDHGTGKWNFIDIASRRDRVSQLSKRNEAAMQQLNAGQRGEGYVIRYKDYTESFSDLLTLSDILK